MMASNALVMHAQNYIVFVISSILFKFRTRA
jgi:hypothetical protein